MNFYKSYNYEIEEMKVKYKLKVKELKKEKGL